MNQIMLVGHVGRDAELTYTPNGMALAKFSIADSHGKEDKKVTTWYNIVAWNKTGEFAATTIKKGMQVLVIGTLAPREYTGKDGAVHTSMDVTAERIQLLGKRPEGEPATKGESSEGFPF